MLVGELARRSGVAAKTLRYYEAIGVLPAPARTPAGYRDYDESALDRLTFIRSAQAAGLTLAEIREIVRIRSQGVAPCTHVRALLEDKAAAVRRQVTELQALQRDLDRLRARAERVDPAECAPASICDVLVPAVADGATGPRS
jgi:MerR family transcriptional regulator, copper efflux regulator